MYSEERSLIGNTCAQIYSHKGGFSAVYPIPKANDEHIGGSFGDLIHEYGIPDKLTFDGAMVQKERKTTFMELTRKHIVNYHISQPYRPNENPAEASIRELKKNY